MPYASILRHLIFRLLTVAVVTSQLIGADTAPSPASGLKLWYDQPSEKWTDALPLGNGRKAETRHGKPKHVRS
ncbi:MAG: hypothetical protein EXS37_19685 [Opitutus sp.]|nr:hypothetical protein [Opitutus sp.]